MFVYQKLILTFQQKVQRLIWRTNELGSQTWEGQACDHEKQKTLSVEMGEDAIAEIFMWLPVKSLLKFKSLSKRWFFLISDRESYFRDRYISTMGIRKRNRIIGRDNSNPIMLGYIFQKLLPYEHYGKPHYLPTSVELDNFLRNRDHNDQDHQAAAAANSCRFTVDQPADFLFHHLAPHQSREIYVVASSNGFLLCSLGRCDFPKDPAVAEYLLANPITKEWAFLPKTRTIARCSNISFVCKGDYPLLALVEYTIVRLVSPLKLDGSTHLAVEILYNGDDRWRQFDLTTFGPQLFVGFYAHNVVITTSDQGCGETTVYAPCNSYRQALSFQLDKKKLIMCDDKKQQLVGMITELPEMDTFLIHMFNSHHLEEVDGSLHYIYLYGRAVDNICLEVWALANSKEWYLKHRVSMGNTIQEAQWINPKEWDSDSGPWIVEGFHPLDPKLIFLTIFRKKVWYNVDTQTIELVADFSGQNLRRRQFVHFAYQWPCWPPLL